MTDPLAQQERISLETILGPIKNILQIEFSSQGYVYSIACQLSCGLL